MAKTEAPRTSRDYEALGQRYSAAGDFDKAGAAYLESLRRSPASVDAAIGLAYAAHRTGKPDLAVRVLETALQHNPGQSRLLNALGLVLAEHGQAARSVVTLKQALERDPRDIEIACNLGDVLCRVGHYAEAFAAYRQAVHLRPDDQGLLRQLAGILEKQVFTAVDERLFDDLLRIFDLRSIDPRFIGYAIVSALRLHPDIAACLARAGSGRGQDIDYAETSTRLSQIPLLLRLMEATLVPSIDMELMLTMLRQRLLRADERSGTAGLRFSAALALQCFENEYAYFETEEEAAELQLLQEKLRTGLGTGADISPLSLAALAAYRPLHSFEWAGQLLDRQWPEAVQPILARQIVAPREELQLRQSISRLTEIDDAVSVMVRDQYEVNPYPRWNTIPLPAAPRPLQEDLYSYCPHLKLAAHRCVERPDILIAGCGTGRQPIYAASGIQHARLLAIDLSLSSLAYAMRKSRELGYPNIEYRQADLLRVKELNESFDYIECGGVLHHLGNPLAGLRALVSVLRPGGLMRLSLYSQSERGPWFAKTRSALDAKGLALPRLPAELRRARREIIEAIAAPTADPDLKKIGNYINFYSLSECRDLLFHVQEHQFDVAGIERALDECGLHFLGFEESANVEVMTAFRQLHPQPEAMMSLPLWRSFEARFPGSLVYRFFCQKPAAG